LLEYLFHGELESLSKQLPCHLYDLIIYEHLFLFRIVQIEPDQELRFVEIKGDNTGQLKSTLTITNVSKGSLAYKVKTTAPRQYVVKPN